MFVRKHALVVLLFATRLFASAATVSCTDTHVIVGFGLESTWTQWTSQIAWSAAERIVVAQTKSGCVFIMPHGLRILEPYKLVHDGERHVMHPLDLMRKIELRDAFEELKEPATPERIDSVTQKIEFIARAIAL